jgi:hypothetical protein
MVDTTHTDQQQTRTESSRMDHTHCLSVSHQHLPASRRLGAFCGGSSEFTPFTVHHSPTVLLGTRSCFTLLIKQAPPLHSTPIPCTTPATAAQPFSPTFAALPLPIHHRNQCYTQSRWMHCHNAPDTATLFECFHRARHVRLTGIRWSNLCPPATGFVHDSHV